MSEVDDYVLGRTKRPDEHADPKGATNRKFNDTCAKVLIMRNISHGQMVPVQLSRTSHGMWTNLEAMHESQSHETIIASYTRSLFRTYVEEGDDIIKHLNKLKQYWERINHLGDDVFKISDHLFRIIIPSSLLPS